MYGECERASGAYSAGESTALIPDASVSPASADGKSAIGAVRKALDDLETIFLAIDKKYKEDVEKGDYDTYEEQFLDLKQVRAGITTRQPVKTEAGQGDEDAEMDTA
jgi:two-component SAPR family response regulator